MLKITVQRYIIFGFSLFFLFSCSRDRFAIKLEQDRVPVKIVRLDTLLNRAASPEDLCQRCSAYDKGCTDYFLAFKVRPQLIPESCAKMHGLLADTSYNIPAVQEAVSHVWTPQRLDNLQKEMEGMFAYYVHYFNKPVPEIYLVSSFDEFGVAGFAADTSLLVGIDMYLGDTFRYYQWAPAYVVRKWKPQYIRQNIAINLLDYLYDQGSMTDATFLSQMLWKGKEVMLAQMLNPDMPDTLLLGMTKEQVKWCYDNEATIWKHLTGEKLLHNTEKNLAQRYLEEAPFTAAPNVPPMAAPRFAVFAGWRLLLNYLDKNPEATPQQLLADKNHEKILHRSGYKPR